MAELISEELKQLSSSVHYHFASFFDEKPLVPYAYLVSKKLEEGHICLSLDAIKNKAEALPDKSWAEYLSDNKAVKNSRFVSADPHVKRPFILHGERLYLQRYFHYETVILNRLKAFLQAEEDALPNRIKALQDHEELIKKLFAPQSNITAANNTDWQLTAAITGALHNFTIITGGPGTGKTTTVAKILALLFTLNPQLKVALAAPTGKAAARMAESLKGATLPVDEKKVALFQALTPSTIHRLLKTIPESCHFQHNSGNPLPYNVVIVDESSMIDVGLFAKLLDAIGKDTRLIMLGDRNQLASVEAGSLFGDLCEAQQRLNVFSNERATLINTFITTKEQQIQTDDIANPVHPLFEHVIELRHSHRFNDAKGIGRISKAVIKNEKDIIDEFFTAQDEQVTIDTTYSQEVFEKFISGYEAYIREKDILAALQQLNNLRVLCAVREGEQGLYALNRQIEAFLHRKGLIQKSGEFYVNRPVIVTRNFYHLDLFNGDIGILRHDSKGVLRAWFEDKDGKEKAVLPGYIAQAETVYAMTIHKSQGSEFNNVLVVLPNKVDLPLLTRELLYTAVTRARKQVIIQGTKEVVLKAADSCVERGSGIINRLSQK